MVSLDYLKMLTNLNRGKHCINKVVQKDMCVYQMKANGRNLIDVGKFGQTFLRPYSRYQNQNKQCNRKSNNDPTMIIRRPIR